jgi:hypothetical protein
MSKLLVSDIREQCELLEQMEKMANSERAKKYHEKIYKIYDECEEIQQVLRDLENLKGTEYEVDEMGLNSYLELSSDIASLPDIGNYLTNYSGWYKDGRLYQCHGGYVSINDTHDRRDIYVYDHENNKTVIERKLDWMDETYIAAKIAQ